MDAVAAKLPRLSSPPIAISGVAFDHVTIGETVQAVEAMIASGEPHYLVTPNVDFLLQARKDVELRRILFDADLSVCDGMPLVWASRWLNNPLPERVAGSDLLPLLLQVAAKNSYRVFLLGGASEASERAVARIRSQYANLIVAGHYSPPFADLLDMDLATISQQIETARPQLLFVSFGTPKGEKWIRMNYRKLRVPVAVSVGAALDFLAGNVARAPAWMRHSGTEWLFRILQEPRRLTRRYVSGFWFVGRALLRQFWEMRPPARPLNPAVSSPVDSEDSKIQIWKLPEWLDARTVREIDRVRDQILADARPCLVELATVRFIDSSGVGWLMEFQKLARRLGKTLILVAPSRDVSRKLALMRLLDLFVFAPDRPSARRLAQNPRLRQEAAVHFEPGPPQTRLVWEGEITADNDTNVWVETENHLKAGCVGRWPIILDLNGLRYLDSSGALLVIRVRSFCQQRNVTIRIVGVQRNVANTLELAKCENIAAEVRE